MPDILDLSKWRVPSREEMKVMYGEAKRKAVGSLLVIRNRIKPIDLYCYLRARFGDPNGLQTMLKSDDSDNIFHWDYALKCGDHNISITATSRELHVAVGEKLSDTDWKTLILGLKSDFGQWGAQKSAVLRQLEKWVVFQNKYSTLANLCADLHAKISDMPGIDDTVRKIQRARTSKGYVKLMQKLSSRSDSLYGDCLKLRLLTPVMAEAFINLVILVLCKDEVRNDEPRYNALVREKIPERLALLSQECSGFARHVNQTVEPYSSFKRVMDKRNFAIHGNVDPIREAIETVYFQGKMPIFADNGDHILSYFTQQEAIANPNQTLADYEAVHLFLLEIIDCMTRKTKAFFIEVADDPFPGYEVHRKRVTKILPGHNAAAMFPGLRYDDDLKVEW